MAEYSIFFVLAYAYFLVNYFVPNGFFYWFCWKAQFPWWANNRIQKDREPRPDQVETEIKSSLKSLAWYAAIATLVFYCYRHGYTSMTTEPASRGYHLLSLLLLMLLHDTSFYWIHRLLHTRKLFQLVHKHHHDSRAPTPWAAYSLSAGESIVQCPLWVLCFTIPAHPLVVLAVLFLQNIYDTFGHLGYEFFPQWILRNKWICAVQATPSHHDAHHRYFRGNYSHYFNIWDLLMRTEIPKYSHMRETVYQAAGERPLPNALRPKALAPARDESRHPVLTPLRGDEFAVPTAQHASL